jgi:hypothetical protein
VQRRFGLRAFDGVQLRDPGDVHTFEHVISPISKLPFEVGDFGWVWS